MLTVNVELGERGYPIVIGAGLLGDQGLAARIGGGAVGDHRHDIRSMRGRRPPGRQQGQKENRRTLEKRSACRMLKPGGTPPASGQAGAFSADRLRSRRPRGSRGH